MTDKYKRIQEYGEQHIKNHMLPEQYAEYCKKQEIFKQLVRQEIELLDNQ